MERLLDTINVQPSVIWWFWHKYFVAVHTSVFCAALFSRWQSAWICCWGPRRRREKLKQLLTSSLFSKVLNPVAVDFFYYYFYETLSPDVCLYAPCNRNLSWLMLEMTLPTGRGHICGRAGLRALHHAKGPECESTFSLVTHSQHG